MNYISGFLRVVLQIKFMEKSCKVKMGILPCLFLLSISCGPQERVSKEVFEEANRHLEVKRISEAQIIEEAMIWGDSISQEAQKELIAKLQASIAEVGIPGAIEFCSTNALSILNEFSQSHQVKLRRVSNKYRNPSDQPDDSELPILEAYEYNAENGLESEPNIQKLNGGEVLLYTKPIVTGSGLCLSCHGEQGKEINDETANKLSTIYSNDLAQGYKLGDLRGMWSIRIPKSEVAKRL